MNEILIQAAKEYVEMGLSVIPVKSDKSPAIHRWSPFQKSRMNNSEIEKYFSRHWAKGVAIVTGFISGNLEVIDIDLKNDETGQLAKEFSALLKNTIPDVHKKLVVIRTVNNGLHIYYKCDTVEGNQKLASNTDGEVLIETRGEGGYVVAPPTGGYALLFNNLNSIPTLTKEERDIVLSAARSFDRSVESEVTEKHEYEDDEYSPFGQFNANADIPALLVKNSWTNLGQRDDLIYFRRPGKDHGVSAIWNISRRVFYNFSTSTVFEAGKGYSPVGVFAILECGGDFSEASKKLAEIYAEQNNYYNPNSTNGAESSDSGIYSALVLLNKEKTEIDYLVDGLIPRYGLIVIAGSSDCGKSSLVRQLSTTIVTGQQYFLGMKIFAVNKRGLYISTEDDVNAVSFLLKKQLNSEIDKNDYDRLTYIFDTEDILKKVESELNKAKQDFVIVDTFTDLYSGNLNQSNEVRGFFNRYKKLADTHKTLFIFIHHNKKGSQHEGPSKENVLGSQGIEAKMRLVLDLRKDASNPEIRYLSVTKGNYLPEERKKEAMVLRFDNNMLFHNTGDTILKESLDISMSANNSKNAMAKQKAIELKRTYNLSIRDITVKLNEEGFKVSKSTISNWLYETRQTGAMYGYEDPEAHIIENYTGYDESEHLN